MWILMLSGQWMLVTSHPGEGNYMLALQIAMVGLVSLASISRVWYIGQNYFLGGLREIFAELENFEPDKSHSVLPLHSTPMLARFESIFNSLTDRLRAYKQELSQWMFLQSEQSRIRALGEISALVVHDLSAPLHVIHFCTNQLKESPELIRDPRYIEQLTVNGQRAQDLIDSLRAYLKSQPMAEASTSFDVALAHVRRLLETQFISQGFQRIEFSIDKSAATANIRMFKAELIHILLNLLSNSVENLLSNAVAKPRIRIGVARRSNGEISLELADNGTGLSPERFEQLTSLSVTQGAETNHRQGLGLKLIRRLIESQQGKLEVASPREGESGTVFILTLNLADNAIGDRT
jgi:signal transduction histidine kinase